MDTQEKLAELRRIMDRENISAYVISGTDPHNSEYLPAPWQQREWFSGFTGSFGTVVVTMDDAGLWTDTRYFIQAERELQGSGIRLHKLRVPDAVDYPQWLLENLPADSKVGIDGFCMSVNDTRVLKDTLAAKNITVKEQIDLLGEIWLDRPHLPLGPLARLRDEYAGETVADKLAKVRRFLDTNHGNYIIFSALDEIAWLYNIRCDDIPYNPVAISYALVEREKAHLFIKKAKITPPVAESLAADGIVLHDYHHLTLFLDDLHNQTTFLVDPRACNYAIYNRLSSAFRVIELPSPVPLMKAVKTPVELDGFRRACLKDAVALAKFLHWLHLNVPAGTVTELDAADRLTRFRAEDPEYVSDSFETISAYGPNAALPHYAATPDAQSTLQPRGLYLVDSGAHYLHGTTDITRTIPLGPITPLEREDYTLVLKGMIALSRLTFPRGLKGCHLDLAARLPLYMHLRDFGHGTGHGVGYFLNVHEGPQSIRPDLNPQEILPGMVTSNEPGLYRENHHGIRHENLLACQPAEENEFGTFLRFETLTLCPFSTEAVDPALLDSAELAWLNDYNEHVYQSVASLLPDDVRTWLRAYTAPLLQVSSTPSLH